MEAHKPHTEHDTIDDIWSGDTLRKDADLQTNSFLALGISTDGVALFKSSKTSLWPVYLLIQNLPPQVRFKGENIILCGIWQGSRKPDMNVLLKPVVKSIQQLKEHGVIIQTPIGPKLYHAKLVLGIFDAPAKQVFCVKSSLTENLAVPLVFILENVYRMVPEFIYQRSILSEHIKTS